MALLRGADEMLTFQRAVVYMHGNIDKQTCNDTTSHVRRALSYACCGHIVRVQLLMSRSLSALLDRNATTSDPANADRYCVVCVACVCVCVLCRSRSLSAITVNAGRHVALNNGEVT
jgi:hypothetical protein